MVRPYEAFQDISIGSMQAAVTPKSLAASSAGLFRGTPSGSNPIMKLADRIAGSAHTMMNLSHSESRDHFVKQDLIKWRDSR